MWTIADKLFDINVLRLKLAGLTFPQGDPFFGKQYQIAVSDLAT
jgi:hypothetical protein